MPNFFKSSQNPGCSGLPAGGWGVPNLSFLLTTLAFGERAKEEKKGFSGDTPAPPAEGLPPSCTTR